MASGLCRHLFINPPESGGFQLVAFREDDVIADRGLVEHLHHLAIDVLQAVPGVDQDEHPLQNCTPAQIIFHQALPALDQVLRRLGKAITRHVDQA